MRADAKAGRLTSDEDKLMLSDGNLQLTMYRASGGIRFIDRARWQVDDRKSNLDIEDAAATRLAQGYIKKNDLAPADQLKFFKAARLRVGEATEGGSRRPSGRSMWPLRCSAWSTRFPWKVRAVR